MELLLSRACYVCCRDLVQVNDSVTCVASDGWSLLAGDTQGRLHVIEVSCMDSLKSFRTRLRMLMLGMSRSRPHCFTQLAGRCAGTCVDILKSHSQAILSISGALSSTPSPPSNRFSRMCLLAVCSDGALTSSRDGFVRAWLPM